MEGLPTALPFNAIEDAEAPVNEVPTTKLFVPKFGVPVTVMRFPMPLIATAPKERIPRVTLSSRLPFPVSDRAPTVLVQEPSEPLKDAVLGAVAPTLKEPETE